MGEPVEDPLGNAHWVGAERLATHLDRILDRSAPHSAERAASNERPRPSAATCSSTAPAGWSATCCATTPAAARGRHRRPRASSKRSSTKSTSPRKGVP